MDGNTKCPHSPGSHLSDPECHQDREAELAKEDARSWRQDFREEIAEIDAMVEIEVKAA